MNIHRSCTERSLLPEITRKCYRYRVNQTSDCNGARLRSISYLKTERNISQTVEQPCVRGREQMLLWTDQKLRGNTSSTQRQTAFSFRTVSLTGTGRSGVRRVIGIDTELSGDPVSLSETCTVCAGSYGWRMLCGHTLPTSFAESVKRTPVYMLISQYMYYFTWNIFLAGYCLCLPFFIVHN